MANNGLPAIRTEVFQLSGGLDLVSPALALAPGNLIDAVNFEPDINGGYRRMYGMERLDGRPSPTDANYYGMAVSLSGAVSAGDTITGAVSGATAVVVLVNGTTSLVVVKVVGLFTTEAISVSGTTVGTVSSTGLNNATTPQLHAAYKRLAANNYRADIKKPAGSGPILGAWYYGGKRYCFRNNAGGTKAIMFAESASGWQALSFGREILFSSAVGQINEGDTVTGGTSGATGVVKRALLRTGTWTSSGVGSLVFDTVTGTFQNGEALKVATVTKATSSSADTAISLLPSGRFEFVNTNFSGTTATNRMYFADGVNHLCEFDGTRLVPIRTGIGNDTPKYVAGWKNMLVCAVSSSVQLSGIGQPYSWTALTGAAELALGSDCTGLLPQLGDQNSGAMAIFTASQTFILYGNSTADFRLVLNSPDAGNQPYCCQNIGYAYYLDTKGVVQINSTRSFGNFEMSTLTRKVQPIIDKHRGAAVASCIVRSTNQYRVFFNDGTGIILYMQRGQTQQTIYGEQTADGVGAIMFFDYGSWLGTGRYFNTVVSYVDSSGVEHVMASGSDGYVYELDRGTSIDGENMQSHMLLAFNSSKSPRLRKRYKRMVLQATCQTTANINIGYELNYGSSETSGGYRGFNTLIGNGSYWDIFTWDSFNWDGPYVSEYTVDTPGNGRNIGMLIYGDTDLDMPYTIHSAILHFIPGRVERGA